MTQGQDHTGTILVLQSYEKGDGVGVRGGEDLFGFFGEKQAKRKKKNGFFPRKFFGGRRWVVLRAASIGLATI